MKIPDKIKIGGHDVDVKIVSPADLGPDVGGDFQGQYNLIRISNDSVESCMARTLMHEIVEWISGHHELNMEHSQVTSLAENLFQVLRDNNLDFRGEASK